MASIAKKVVVARRNGSRVWDDVRYFCGSQAYLREEPVEENHLVAVRRDDEPISEELKRRFPEIMPYA